MRKIWIVARREYNAFFNSPVAYALAGAILFIIGIIYAANIFFAAQSPGFVPGVEIVIDTSIFMFVLTIPALTMRLISDETRLGTMELLLTSPVRDVEVILGKWLGAFLFVLTVIASTLIYPIMINGMIQPGIDTGLMLSGYLGLILASGSLVAIGLMISSFFSNIIASFFVTMSSFVVIWFLMGIPGQLGSGRFAALTRALEFRAHYQSMVGGVINLSDVIYFLSVIVLFIAASSVSLETRRWR